MQKNFLDRVFEAVVVGCLLWGLNYMAALSDTAKVLSNEIAAMKVQVAEALRMRDELNNLREAVQELTLFVKVTQAEKRRNH